MKILASHDIEKFSVIIHAILTLPGLIVLSIFIIFGHISAYHGWNILMISWNPSKISPFTGIIYLFLLVCSVLAHELGHLAVAVYVGEPSVEICIKFNSWLLPKFMTKHNIRYNMIYLKSRSRKPLLNLAGIYTQLLFASALGTLFFLTQTTVLPASVSLIDIGALAALVPTHGTDGYWYVIDIQRAKYIRDGLNKKNFRYIQRILFLLYIVSTLALFLGVIYQWVNGWYIKMGLEESETFYEIFGYLTLPIPAILYAIWTSRFLRRLLMIS